MEEGRECVHLCLEMLAPGEGGGYWTSSLLQKGERPSLLIPTEEAS